MNRGLVEENSAERPGKTTNVTREHTFCSNSEFNTTGSRGANSKKLPTTGTWSGDKTSVSSLYCTIVRVGKQLPAREVAFSPCFDYSGIYLVSNAEYRCAKHFFGCAVWNPMGKFSFLSQQLILFVRGNYCNCAGLCGHKMELCAYELWSSVFSL
jgi:hypothetical protein